MTTPQIAAATSDDADDDDDDTEKKTSEMKKVKKNFKDLKSRLKSNIKQNSIHQK